MASFDWKGTIGTVAPVLAGIFGSPVAGVGVSALCKAFGLEPSPENASKIAQQAADGTLSGADWAKIKLAEIDVQAQLKKMDLDFNLEEDKLVAADVDSARNRQIQLKDRTPQVGFYVVSVGFFALLILLAFHQVPPSSRDLLNVMLGALGVAWTSMVKFFYGGSKDDVAVNEMLHRSTPVDGGGK
jgi:hypothetical protein